MKFSAQELQEIINGNPVGDDWPFLGGTNEDIRQHLQGVVEKLNQSVVLEVEAEFDSFGEGSASYAHLFCKRPHQESSYVREGRTWTDGIAVYLSRLTPVAIYGTETRTTFERGSSHGFLEVEGIGQIPDASWTTEESVIQSILTEEGFTFLSSDELKQPLPFKAGINTEFDGKRLFDALFFLD